MRPVNKGHDRGEFDPYNNAQEPLIKQLGEYCSYCERWIASGIHVEHKKPKAPYPELKFKWTNFLLACANCNSAKGSDQFELDDYLWPDTDNTMKALKYEVEGRVLPASGFGAELDHKIKETWKLFGLNRHPDTTIEGFVIPTAKDKRWLHRKQEWEKATKAKKQLLGNDSADIRELLIDLAKAKGMFSIWFTVFHNDSDIKSRLVREFSNTAISCFDDDFCLTPRPGGKI